MVRRPASTHGQSFHRKSAQREPSWTRWTFDFFELLDKGHHRRSRKHIQTFYDTKDIGQFPERRKPLSFHSPLTQRTDVMSFNEIFEQPSLLKLAMYAPISYILPSRLKKYEEMYDTQVAERQAQASRPRKEPAGVDDDQFAQAFRKLD